jgi:bacterioferritin
MKTYTKLVAILNSLLIDKLAEIKQNLIHSEMCENWGYNKLHLAITKQVMDEMNQAEWMLERISLFEVESMIESKKKDKKPVTKMLSNDNWGELEATHNYIEAIIHARELDDTSTVSLLIDLIKMEEDRIGILEKHPGNSKKEKLKIFQINQIKNPTLN